MLIERVEAMFGEVGGRGVVEKIVQGCDYGSAEDFDVTGYFGTVEGGVESNRYE
jgi:hypothetical protein